MSLRDKAAESLGFAIRHGMHQDAEKAIDAIIAACREIKATVQPFDITIAAMRPIVAGDQPDCKRCGFAFTKHMWTDGIGYVCPVAAITYEAP